MLLGILGSLLLSFISNLILYQVQITKPLSFLNWSEYIYRFLFLEILNKLEGSSKWTFRIDNTILLVIVILNWIKPSTVQDPCDIWVGRNGCAGPFLQDVQGVDLAAGVLSFLLLLLHAQGVGHHQGHVTAEGLLDAASGQQFPITIISFTRVCRHPATTPTATSRIRLLAKP